MLIRLIALLTGAAIAIGGLFAPSLKPDEKPEAPEVVTLTISAVGDVVLGGDRRWAGYHAFMREYRNNGLEWFFHNVRHVFEESDLSIANLEGVLTNITYPHMDKQFVFRGPPHFARILTYGNIGVVSIANNHTIDFFDRGYQDTKEALRAESIKYFGNNINTIMGVNGIKVGLFGFRIWADNQSNRNLIANAIYDLQYRGAQLIIAFHHWGVERATAPSQYQINIGRFTIEQGAHLVLGAHPHVLQGIEEFRGRNIVYSLGDFSFGGNASRVSETMIFQQTFTFVDGELVNDNETNIIPAFMSSVPHRNNMQPTIAKENEAERILGMMREYSNALNSR
ncbi:MAG: CapA family protein [Clostridiales bacterium]|jgi:poly-gamma-glutamate synthesis protein (capsule biosynthesis protein)|nr:CapA family protein [Clostridiales bacterium]